jgi:hypothetical protein
MAAYGRYVTWIIVFVAVVGIAFATLTIADAARNDGARVADSVDNESIVQEVGLWQFTNQALDDDTAGFNETVTVYNSSGDELTRGTDYEWNATDGSITYFNTANVTDGLTGNISYAYFRNTQPVNELAQIVAPVVALVSWSPLLVGGLALAMILLAAAALVGRYMGGSDRPRSNR